MVKDSDISLNALENFKISFVSTLWGFEMLFSRGSCHVAVLSDHNLNAGLRYQFFHLNDVNGFYKVFLRHCFPYQIFTKRLFYFLMWAWSAVWTSGSRGFRSKLKQMFLKSTLTLCVQKFKSIDSKPLLVGWKFQEWHYAYPPLPITILKYIEYERHYPSSIIYYLFIMSFHTEVWEVRSETSEAALAICPTV